MWRCNKCGSEVEMHTMTLTEKNYELKRNVGVIALKKDSVVEKTLISYKCTNCDNGNDNLEKIAKWIEEE